MGRQGLGTDWRVTGNGHSTVTLPFEVLFTVPEAAPAADDEDQLVILDEFYRHESHVEDAIAWLEGRPQGIIYSEHEPSDIEKFDRAGWRAEKADKSIAAGIAEVRKRLKEDPETGRVGLLISERAENLVKEFGGYKVEHVGTSQAVDDGLDACRYLCQGATDPTPRAGGVMVDFGPTDNAKRWNRRNRRLGGGRW